MQEGPRLKRWIVLLSIAWLAAGVAFGLALPRLYEVVVPPPAGELWLQTFQAKYEPTAAQLRQIQKVLAVKQREIMVVYQEQTNDLPEIIRRQIEVINVRADDRIEAVLDDRQRRLYRMDRKDGVPAALAPTPGTRDK